MASEQKIREILSHIEEGFGPSFFDHVAEDVSWTVTGVDNPIGGHRSNKTDIKKPYQRIGALMETPIKPKIRHILIGNTGDEAFVEFTAMAKIRNGGDFALDACWFCRFKEDKIVEVRGYMDSALMKRVLDEHEK